MLLVSGLSAQNIITVSPIPLQGDYTDLQTAINDASSGDTIYCYPGVYGTINIDKKVILIASGYRFNENPSLNISTFTTDTWAQTINFNTGSDFSVIKGFRGDVLNIISANSIVISGYHNTSDVLIDHSVNTTIRKSFFSGSEDQFRIQGESAVMLSNCLISRSSSSPILTVTASSSADIWHCVFLQDVALNNSTIRNSVFLDGGQGTGTNNSYLYNVFTSSSTGFGPTNTTGVSSSSIFVGIPSSNGYSFDGRYQLQPGSPAAGAGEGGVDCGVFAGSLPYKLSGIPDIPLIYELNVPQNATGGSMDVNIKVRAEN